MSDAPARSWTDAVRAADAGPELLGFLRRRLTQPYEEGPPLDDRRTEGPERIFEEIAAGNDAFRLRLEDTIAGYLKSDEASPGDASAYPLIRGLLDLVQHLALGGVFTPLRAWLERHQQALAAEPDAVLGRAVLGALATSQVRGLKEHRDFWMRVWQSDSLPLPWRARAFIGLRLQDLQAAASELPQLVRYAGEAGQDPGPLLKGMWLQPDGCGAICNWLQNNSEHPAAAEIREALRRKLPEAEWPKIPKAPPKRSLRSLSSGRALADDWAQ
jgi:hypothetical protein